MSIPLLRTTNVITSSSPQRLVGIVLPDCKIFEFVNTILQHYSLPLWKGLYNSLDAKQRGHTIGYFHVTPETVSIIDEYCCAKKELHFNELIIEKNFVKLKLFRDIEIIIIPRSNIEIGTKAELSETIYGIFKQMFGSKEEESTEDRINSNNVNGMSQNLPSSSSSSTQEGLHVLSIAAQRGEILQKRLVDIDNSINLLQNIRKEIADELMNIEGFSPPGGAIH
jgi:hypothetical protein